MTRLPYLTAALSIILAACGKGSSSLVAPEATAIINATAASTWRAIDMGFDPNYFGTSAAAISDRGHIAGHSFQAFLPQAFIHRRGSQRQYVLPLPGDSGAFPLAINDEGLMAGVSQASTFFGPFQAVYWDPEGRVFPIPGVVGGKASGMSSNGWIVGDGSFPGIVRAGFRWRRGGTLLVLRGDAMTSNAGASGVNDEGYVVGDEASGPVIWSPTGTLERLPMPTGALGGTALDINNAGEVVGTFTMANFSPQAFKWTREDGLALLQAPLGYTSTFAADIDSRGRIYGWASVGGTPAPYVWENGVPIPLPKPLAHSFVSDVNSCGVAVGGGVDIANVHVVAWITDC